MKTTNTDRILNAIANLQNTLSDLASYEELYKLVELINHSSTMFPELHLYNMSTFNADHEHLEHLDVLDSLSNNFDTNKHYYIVTSYGYTTLDKDEHAIMLNNERDNIIAEYVDNITSNITQVNGSFSADFVRVSEAIEVLQHTTSYTTYETNKFKQLKQTYADTLDSKNKDTKTKGEL